VLETVLDTLKSATYSCARLVCGGVKCGPGAWDRCPDYEGKVADCAGQTDAGGFKLTVEMEPCSLEEFSDSLKEAGASLTGAVDHMMTESASFLPEISESLRAMMYNQLVAPFLSLIDQNRLNCGFMETAWTSFLEGTCYEVVGSILTFRMLISIQAFLASLMAILLFILWRHFLDTRKVALAEVDKEGRA